MIVVDASLAAKWFLTEHDQAAALRFLNRYAHRMLAPDLLLVEVAGAIVRRGNSDKASRQQGQDNLANWREMQDDGTVRTERPGSRQVEAAGLLALTLGRPIADCVYLQLAIERRLELATCDEKFRIKALRVYDRVRLLRQYDD